MKGPLDESDVAEQIEIAARGRVAFDTSAPLGEQDEWKVRPLGLRLDETVERPQVGAAQCFVGDERKAGPV
ncbi:hypothetical protein [Sphingopyxis fribergensis]